MVDDENQEGDGIGQSSSSPATAGDGSGNAAAGERGGALGDEDTEGRSGGKKQQEEDEEEEEVELEEPDEEALGKMSALEQRLFKVRLKMNKVWQMCQLVICLG